MNAYIRIGGAYVLARSMAQNLVRTDGTQQDGIAAVWTWVWKYQIPSGNLIAFKAQRNGRYALTMTLYDAPTTALADAAQLRLVVYYPDALTMKKILWSGTYGTIKNGTKYNLEAMVVVTDNYDVQPDEWLFLECYHATHTVDISECSIDLGCTRWVPA